MNYKQVRQKFVEITGRYDLVTSTSTWEDNGANFFINEAQNYLDRLVEYSARSVELSRSLGVGSFIIDIPGLKVVDKVWVSNTSGETTKQLTRLELSEARNIYHKDSDFSTITNGDPLYYVIGVPRDGAHTPYKSTIKRLLILPPTDEAVTIRIAGKMYQKLVEDNDENWWTIEHPFTLIAASQLMVEMLYRNTQGVGDMNAALGELIRGIDAEFTEEMVAEVDIMKNSWRYQDEKGLPEPVSFRTTDP